MQYLRQPWDHQLKTIEQVGPTDRDCFGLFWDPGTGKSSTVINILRHRFNGARRVLPTLILGPVIILENWKKEWLMNSKINPEQLVVLSGSGVSRLKKFRAAREQFKDHFIAITNYDALVAMPALFNEFRAWAPEVLIADESHYCKNHKAKRTTRVDELANPRGKARPFVMTLSGTPILASPMDLFSQFLILDGGRTFGMNFFAFQRNYFYDKNAGMPKQRYFPDWRLKAGALDEMTHRASLVSSRMRKDECLDLPPLVETQVPVDMAPDQRKAYNQMRDEFIAVVDQSEEDERLLRELSERLFKADVSDEARQELMGRIEELKQKKMAQANMAVTKALRLTQISAGFLPVGPHGEEIHRFKDTPKREALKSYLSEIAPHHKVIVWAVFHQNYAEIREVLDELQLEYVEVHGGITSNAKKFANVDRFNQDPKCRVFLGHPGSGGVGINLVVAPFSVVYSRTPSLGEYDQSKARNHRGGSEIHEKITRYELVCQNSIDEIIIKKIAMKQLIGDSFDPRDLSLELKKQRSEESKEAK